MGVLLVGGGGGSRSLSAATSVTLEVDGRGSLEVASVSRPEAEVDSFIRFSSSIQTARWCSNVAPLAARSLGSSMERLLLSKLKLDDASALVAPSLGEASTGHDRWGWWAEDGSGEGFFSLGSGGVVEGGGVSMEERGAFDQSEERTKGDNGGGLLVEDVRR